MRLQVLLITFLTSCLIWTAVVRSAVELVAYEHPHIVIYKQLTHALLRNFI